MQGGGRQVDRQEAPARGQARQRAQGPAAGLALQVDADAVPRRLQEPGQRAAAVGEAGERLDADDLQRAGAHDRLVDGLGATGGQQGGQGVVDAPPLAARLEQGLDLHRHRVGDHLQHDGVAAAHPVLRGGGQAAERAVQPAVGQPQRGGQVAADHAGLHDVDVGGRGVLADVGHDGGQAAVEDPAAQRLLLGLAVTDADREARRGRHVPEDLPAVGELGDEGDLLPELPAHLVEQVVHARERVVGGAGGRVGPGHGGQGVPGVGEGGVQRAPGRAVTRTQRCRVPAPASRSARRAARARAAGAGASTSSTARAPEGSRVRASPSSRSASRASSTSAEGAPPASSSSSSDVVAPSLVQRAVVQGELAVPGGAGEQTRTGAGVAVGGEQGGLRPGGGQLQVAVEQARAGGREGLQQRRAVEQGGAEGLPGQAAQRAQQPAVGPQQRQAEPGADLQAVTAGQPVEHGDLRDVGGDLRRPALDGGGAQGGVPGQPGADGQPPAVGLQDHPVVALPAGEQAAVEAGLLGGEGEQRTDSGREPLPRHAAALSMRADRRCSRGARRPFG